MQVGLTLENFKLLMRKEMKYSMSIAIQEL